MTVNDQENIERKLNHVLEMGKRIIDLYRHITCTERAALLLAMTAAVRQVAANMHNVAVFLRTNIIDQFRIDYTAFAREIENLHKIWVEELKGAPIFHNLDSSNLPITNPDEIAFKEDTHYDLNIRTEDDDQFDFYDTRVGLMDHASLMCEAVEKGLTLISKTLREIVDDYEKLKSDDDIQDDRLRELEEKYENKMWEDDKDRFIEEVEEYTQVSGDKTKKTYERYLSHLEREATDPLERKVLGELNEWFLSDLRPAAFIVENRDKLTFQDVALHFRFVRCRHLLIKHIESFDLMQPADAGYKDLFVNQAAQELAFLLAKTIATYVDFKHNYQYAALQMAMQDLGLIFTERNNGIQMKDYINKAYLSEDEQIKDQTSLTQWTGKLLGSMFGSMDESNLVGNFSTIDFEKMKDYYWLCLSIINKVVQLDLEELQFAPYLYQEHEKTPSINDYRDRNGQSIMDRLSILKSAIKGETLFS